MPNTLKTDPEWAPMASEAEIASQSFSRRRFMIFVEFSFCLFILIFLIADVSGIVNSTKSFLLPVFKELVCSQPLGFNGGQVALVVAIALLNTLIWIPYLVHVNEWVLILKSRQEPIPGARVLVPTKIKRGFAACLFPMIALIVGGVVLSYISLEAIQFYVTLGIDIRAPVSSEC